MTRDDFTAFLTAQPSLALAWIIGWLQDRPKVKRDAWLRALMGGCK